MNLSIRQAAERVKALYQVREQQETPELPLPFPNLNQRLWGLQRGELVVIGARPGECKSALALHLADHLAQSGARVEFLSLEMTVESLLMRLASSRLSYPFWALKAGKLTMPGEKERYFQFLTDQEHSTLSISLGKGKTLEELQDYLKLTRPDVVFLDYLQNIKKPHRYAIDAYDEYILGARELAQQYHCAVVICSQINRGIKENPDKYPTMEDLKGAGSIEETADVILLNHWPWKWDRSRDISTLLIIVAKSRQGETWVETVRWKPETFSFEPTVWT